MYPVLPAVVKDTSGLSASSVFGIFDALRLRQGQQLVIISHPRRFEPVDLWREVCVRPLGNMILVYHISIDEEVAGKRESPSGRSEWC